MTCRNTLIRCTALLSVPLILNACSNELPDLDLHTNRGHIDLARQVPGDWDRVCILTSDTTPETAADATGAEVLASSLGGLRQDEQTDLLFFLRGRQIFAAYSIPSDSIEFGQALPHCLARDNAILNAAE